MLKWYTSNALFQSDKEAKLAKNDYQRKSLVNLVSEEDTRDALKFNISVKWF